VIHIVALMPQNVVLQIVALKQQNVVDEVEIPLVA
jgi:hypothetical protein